MERQIELAKNKVEYTLRVSQRAGRIRLAIYNDGRFVVTAPYGVDKNIIEHFIKEKADWIIKKLNYFKNNPVVAVSGGNQKDYLKNKDKALALARERVRYFNKNYGFAFKQINVKNQKTRWGSCSKKGNLNFNYKIILAGERLADYVIVHELCHLKEFNHSAKFWSLVAQSIPDYKEARKALKRIPI